MSNVEWFIADRQQGKTAYLINWVKGGYRVSYYPYWDRIILVSSMHEANLLRGGDPETNKYGLEYNQVYFLDEWLNRYQGGLTGPVTIGIDNIEFFLNRMLFNTYGSVKVITATGKVVEREEGGRHQTPTDSGS